MAYMSQEKKKEIAAALKTVMPKTWKWSLGVDHHSTIVLTIASAPVDLLKEIIETAKARNPLFPCSLDYFQVNQYYLETQFSGKRLERFKKIKEVLNKGNHDRSNVQIDYFDVGWYVSINIGRFDRPFKVVR